jgi:DNA-binding PadR family transcriptional regulator
VKESLRAGSGGRIDLPTGTIYPALRRLERAGLISGEWDTTSAARPRRAYRLTPAGRSALSGERAGWREFSDTVTALLEGRPCPTTP